MLELSKDDILNIQETFKFFDVDKKGYLDYYELKAALRALGSQVKKAEVLRIIGAYDKQREGYQKRICYEDFYYVAADKMPVIKLYQQSSHRLLAKMMPPSLDRGCYVVISSNPSA
ncbi:unnamed protein product, partial [Timema podura]|nr:unnamed protein product [Timema podura]